MNCDHSRPLLGVEELKVGYGGRSLLPPISFEVFCEEFWAIIGRNGSGKTTLLRTLLGLWPRVGGRMLGGDELRIGYVPQRADLDFSVPSRVRDVVAGGLERGWSFLSPSMDRRKREILARVQAETEVGRLAKSQMSELSEGQKQRVLLARALACEPQLLVLDEPTSALDIASTRAAYELLDQLRIDHHIAVLVVSHHLAQVSERASNILFVDKDDRIALAGPVEEVTATPAFRRHYGELASTFGKQENNHG